MLIKVLISYPDPMDIRRPPQTYIREWKAIEISPLNGIKYFHNLMGIVII